VLKSALLALAVGSFLGGAATVDSLAVFADVEANAGNVLASGSVSIADAPDSAFLSIANMAPGNSTIVALAISNDGSLALRYSMTSSATDPDGKGLAAQLQLTIRDQTVNGCNAEDGAVLYTGALNAALFGSSAQGAQAGDRTLAASASENLCFKVQFPVGSGNAYQSATTTATFTFDAEQTINNP
jgi:spore coat-associated protein N